jgi:hypothetical protein
VWKYLKRPGARGKIIVSITHFLVVELSYFIPITKT